MIPTYHKLIEAIILACLDPHPLDLRKIDEAEVKRVQTAIKRAATEKGAAFRYPVTRKHFFSVHANERLRVQARAKRERDSAKPQTIGRSHQGNVSVDVRDRLRLERLAVPSHQKIVPPPKSLQKTRYPTSRNPRNGPAILAVPRLNLLCSTLSQWDGLIPLTVYVDGQTLWIGRMPDLLSSALSGPATTQAQPTAYLARYVHRGELAPYLKIMRMLDLSDQANYSAFFSDNIGSLASTLDVIQSVSVRTNDTGLIQRQTIRYELAR
jgi:hypothetical protein